MTPTRQRDKPTAIEWDVAVSGTTPATAGASRRAVLGKVVSQNWAPGEADGCVVFEAPNEQTGASRLVSLAKKGNVRTRTM